MALVRFASICDFIIDNSHEDGYIKCYKRSLEYTTWPTCSECNEHFCPEHYDSDTFEDNDGYQIVMCLKCKKEAGMNYERFHS